MKVSIGTSCIKMLRFFDCLSTVSGLGGWTQLIDYTSDMDEIPRHGQARTTPFGDPSASPGSRTKGWVKERFT